MERTLALLLTIVIISHPSVTTGQQTKTANRVSRVEREVLRANEKYDEALVRGDAAALDRIYADEFIYTDFDGGVRDKAQQLAFTRSGT